jgi:hypothetical protein
MHGPQTLNSAVPVHVWLPRSQQHVCVTAVPHGVPWPVLEDPASVGNDNPGIAPLPALDEDEDEEPPVPPPTVD